MTLFELVALFEERRWMFFGTITIVLLLAVSLYHFQPERYTNELLFSVTRTSVAPTTEYAYDHFYRLQADERIAESLTQYLASETGKRVVAEQAKLQGEGYRNYTENKLKIVRLGTNEVKVDYATSDIGNGMAIGESLVTAANQYLFALNEDARQKEWFTVIGTKPVAHSGLWSLTRCALIGLVAGVLIAFWAVLLNFFWDNYRKERIPKTV